MAGRPPDVSDEEILEILRQSTDPVLFTGEIAEELSIGTDGVRNRLQTLEEENRVQKKQRGKVIVWWIADEK